MATESKKKLALAIIDFLKSSCTDGTLDSEERESIEISTQCIADAFKINPDDKTAMSDALAGQSLLAIYNVFEKMKGKSTPKPATPPTGPKQPSDDERAEAEALKNNGNAAIAQKDYYTAIDFYTQALKIIPINPIYLSNRAAAYIQLEKYDEAIRDAEIAVDTDPSYVKAWSRLGFARSHKGNHRGAMEAYKAGIDADSNGGSKMLRDGFEAARKAVNEEEGIVKPKNADEDGGAFDPASLLGNPELLQNLFGGAGGGAGPGIDMSQIGQMAQNLFGGEGGSIDSDKVKKLMENPFAKELMAKFMGGGGGFPGMPSGSGSGPSQ
ncbi:hypothetical protein BDD12DRAFT_805557 [Trichophaea hybrida]|nr:hypothetical protein BDD12DRAFT_805557 [Trichophaea hybrida]